MICDGGRSFKPVIITVGLSVVLPQPEHRRRVIPKAFVSNYNLVLVDFLKGRRRGKLVVTGGYCGVAAGGLRALRA